MSAGWLVYSLATGTLVTLAAVALERIARAHRWPGRWIWAASLMTSVLLVTGAALDRPVADTSAVAASATSLSGTMAPMALTTFGSIVAGLRALADSWLVGGTAAVAFRVPTWLADSMVTIWMSAALAVLATLALVHASISSARRSWPTAELHGRRVRVAPSVGPAVVGLIRPEIVVPRWLLARSREEQELVLAHEDEHVRARDHLLLGGACIAVALIPWHPAAWWSLARLRLATELDCDARVLGHGVPARHYGAMLIDLAGQCSGFRAGATALADQNSHLERRLLAMRPNTKRPSIVRAAAWCGAAALLLLAACEARVPTSAEIETMDVASAERVAARTGLIEAIHGTPPEFYVNGAQVTAAEAHSIAPNDIATIDVQKGANANAPSVVRIATVAASANGTTYRSAAPAGGETSPTPSKLRGLHDKMSASSHAFSGMILIDGTRADAAALHMLDPKKIVSVEIAKDAEATRISSDPAAKNGIIRVKTNGSRTRS